MTKVNLDDELINLYKSVKEYRKHLSIALSSRGDKKIYVYLKEIIDNDSFKGDYLKLTGALLYEKLSYDDAVESLKRIQQYLEKHHF